MTLNDVIAAARGVADAASSLERRLKDWKEEQFGPGTSSAESQVEGKKRGRPPKVRPDPELPMSLPVIGQMDAQVRDESPE